MTREEIIQGIIETMEHCTIGCSCEECPIKVYCDEWERLNAE